jgi:hypothetical protein
MAADARLVFEDFSQFGFQREQEISGQGYMPPAWTGLDDDQL